MTTSLLNAVLGLVAITVVSSAQLGAQAPQDATSGREPAPQRAELERRFRERSADVVRRQLQLNDEQMSRLQAANAQFDTQRVALAGQERQTRQALRSELTSGAAANQQHVGDLIDQLLQLQRQRLDLVAGEQRELAKFLTPVQRAKYFGLQNQMRKRMQELRERGALGGGRPRRPGRTGGMPPIPPDVR